VAGKAILAIENFPSVAALGFSVFELGFVEGLNTLVAIFGGSLGVLGLFLLLSIAELAGLAGLDGLVGFVGLVGLVGRRHATAQSAGRDSP
jgi:hypothetical protein